MISPLLCVLGGKGMQKLLTEGPLLDKHGNLYQAGYATRLVKTYDRTQIKASPLRIKEWDYYLIANDCHALALTIADNGYMGLISWSLLDFNRAWEQTTSKMTFFPMGKTGLPATSIVGFVEAEGKDYKMVFENDGKKRRLYGNCQRFCGNRPLTFDINLTEPSQDSMVIATPFHKKKAFYYNQKINCLRVEGRAFLGDEEIMFPPATTSAVLDWGRGVWTYDNTWYWSSASGFVNGKCFGFNLGYGFGDTSAASENMLFYDGKAHKLSQVTFEIPQKNGQDDFLSPWRFTSDDGRFEAKFTPILDRAALTDFKLLCSDQHQVFGWFEGQATLDNGEKIPLRHFLGFAEKVRNKW